ncbi:MAG: mannose-1-phosphate guanylyltransferase [Bacteroidales bacterium]|jgi:mannose-1-phosphate guanylyltransferase|nr:mannose-1-phosphate guanylyltransferase [Bacteroidales bacterium]
MDGKNYCVIMAGGIGSRFWPMSKQKKPKQFIDVLGVNKSLLQLTFERMTKIFNAENILIVTSESYRHLVIEQLKGIKEGNILCEPNRRNTAPCIAYANYKIRKDNKDANIVVVPSDHVIENEDLFLKTIEKGLVAAEQEDILITLGIRPSYPNTGYGYVQYIEKEYCNNDKDIKKVKLFAEKPVLEMAEKFIKSGDFLWNAGIFIWNIRSIDKAMKTYCKEIYEAFQQEKNMKEEDFITNAYLSCPSVSIDYAVMERADNVYVIPSDFGWSDVGTWKALYGIGKQDENKNRITGRNVMTYDTQNCIVNMPKDKLVVLQGLDDYIVVENDNILMICKKSEEQRIRQFVTDVEVEKGNQYI